MADYAGWQAGVARVYDDAFAVAPAPGKCTLTESLPIGRAGTQVQRSEAKGGGSPASEAGAMAGRARPSIQDLFGSHMTQREPALWRSAEAAGPATAPPIVDEVLGSGGGAPLDGATRTRMEGRFGQDFSGVRVHTGERAASAARAVSAHAFTVGSDVVFDSGQYDPSSAHGQHLLAHELTHVVQQGGSRVTDGPLHRSASSEGGGQRGVAKRMAALVAQLEQLCAAVAPQPAKPPKDAPKELEAVRAALPELRALASGGDEPACEEALRLFGENMAKAGIPLGAAPEHGQRGGSGAPAVNEKGPSALAKKALGVSHPHDAAEREAEAVADAVMGGGGGGAVMVREAGAEAVHRMGNRGKLIAGAVILGAVSVVVVISWLWNRGGPTSPEPTLPEFPVEEQQPILEAIEAAEQRGGLTSDRAEQARRYLRQLSPTELRSVGDALRVIDRQTEDDEDDRETNGDRAAKLIVAKARLLMWLVEGKTTVAQLGAMERGEDLDQDSNEDREFYVDDEIDDSLSYVREQAFDTETASTTLSSSIVKQEIARWVAELEHEIDAAEQLCSGLREAIIEHVEKLLGSGRFEVLQNIGQVLRTVTTIGTVEQREQPETQQKLRIARVRLLTDLFLHREPVTEVAQRALELTTTELGQLTRDIVDGDVTPDEMQGGNDDEIRVAKQQTMQQHDDERNMLLEILEDGVTSKDVVLKNSCEWLKQRQKVYVVTPTHDGLGRAMKANQRGLVAHFPNQKKASTTVFDAPTDYDDSNDNIIFKSTATNGTNDTGGDGGMTFFKLTSKPREEIERTIIHEVQHSADLHDRSPIARYQSEVNAHTLGHQYGGGYDFLQDKDKDQRVDHRDHNWNEHALGVFEHMYADSSSYDYLKQGWDKNEGGFQDKIAKIDGPHTPNPINSIRIDALLQAARSIKPEDVHDGDLSPVKADAIDEALKGLDDHDRHALAENPAVMKQLEKLPDTWQERLREQFKR